MVKPIVKIQKSSLEKTAFFLAQTDGDPVKHDKNHGF
jgi:hypothetical protein